MTDFVSVLLEETDDTLINNSDYNVKKSELFKWFKEKESTIEMLWVKAKEDAHSKYISEKSRIDETIIMLRTKISSKKATDSKVQSLKVELDSFKEEYKETIKSSANQYKENYSELEEKFEIRLEELRNDTLYPDLTITKVKEMEESLVEEYNHKFEALEQKETVLSKRFQQLKSKVGNYNQALQSLIQNKKTFQSKVEKTKRQINTKMKEIKLKEVEVSKREDKAIKLYASVKKQKKEAEKYLAEVQQVESEYAIKLRDIAKRRKLLLEAKKHRDAGKHLPKLDRAEHFFGLYNIEYDEETLKKAYKKKLHLYHPDKHYGVDEFELENFRDLFEESQHLYKVIKREYGI